MPAAIPFVAPVVLIGKSIYEQTQRKKAEKRAIEYAEAEKAAARAEQKRIEEKYNLSPGELERQERTFALEKRRQTELERRAGLPGEELLKESGPQTRRLMEDVSRRFGMTGEELFREGGGKAAEQFVKEVTSEGPLAQFEPELELVMQEINKQAQRRGVFGGLPEGGIRFEQLGRAGVDLSIRAARERQKLRRELATDLFNIRQGARKEAAQIGESALQISGKSRSEVDQFLSRLQELDLKSQGRAADVATRAHATAEEGVRDAGEVPIAVEGSRVARAAPESIGPAGIAMPFAELGAKVARESSGSEEMPPLTPDIETYRTKEEEGPLFRLGEQTGRTILPYYPPRKRKGFYSD